MKKLLLPISLLSLAVACGGDSDPMGPTAVGPEIAGPNFDDISNNLDASIDAEAEVVGSSTGT